MKPILLAVLAVSPLLADCPSGRERKPTPAELAFQKKALEALAGVFPEAPDGFVKPDLASMVANQPPLSFSSDSPIGSFTIRLSGTYRRASQVDERKTPEWAAATELESKIESLKQFPPDLDAKYKALQAEMSAASSASRKAQRAQDNETAKAQRAIADAKYAEMTALEASYKQSTKAQLDALYAQRSKLVSEIRAKYVDQAVFDIETNRRPFDADPERADVYSFGKPASGLRIHSISAELVAHPITRAMFTVDKAKLSSLVGLQ
ncbi:MAG: hypothetical protein KatS3mg005_3305 [Bryobacteraceae bacterium]|nr:MAG: hypothetical protein KatS3mg005_3305 [Bryobacteraceae bacterium]